MGTALLTDHADVIQSMQTLAELERRTDALRSDLVDLHEMLVLAAQGAQSSEELHGSETVLVADDQILVRAITQAILEDFGYRVVVSDADPKRWPATPIDLVLLDVPTWNAQARRHIESARSRGAAVVVSTPLPDGPVRQQLSAAAFVSKPFHPLTLARCIRHTLTCRPSTGRS